MDKVFAFLNRFNKPVSTDSFGLFRILFSAHILLIISQVFTYRQLIFEAVPGVSKNVFPALLYIFIWTISALFLFTGTKTRWAALVNYVCVVLATSIFTNSNVGTFNDDLLRIGSFLCIFMPVSRSFSFDTIINKLTYINPKPPQTSYLFYILFIFLSLGLLYLPSGLTKTYSPMWLKGLGLWIPSNIPHNHWNQLPNILINQHALLAFINYAVIVWEILFIFLLFFPKTHAYIVIPGLIFHIAIGAMFPFPAVCTGPLTFYALFIPNKFWVWLSEKIKSNTTQEIQIQTGNHLQIRLSRFVSAFDFKQHYRFIESNSGRLSYAKSLNLLRIYVIYRPAIFIKSNKFFRQVIRNIYYNWANPLLDQKATSFFKSTFKYSLLIYFAIFCVVMQMGISTYHVFSHYTTGDQKRMEYMRIRKSGYDLSMKPTNLVRTFFGINSRGLFLDHANTGQKTTYAITYLNDKGDEIWLPMMDERGYVKSELNMNMAWAKVTFNLLGFSTNPADSFGLKLLTRYWADKHHISLSNLTMKVYGKTYTYPTAFEKDYYLKLEQIPWKTEGEIRWVNGAFNYTRLASDTIR